MSNTRPISVIPVGHNGLATHMLETLRGAGRALFAAAPVIDLGVRLLAAGVLLGVDVASLPGNGAIAASLALLLVLGTSPWSIARRIGRRPAGA